MADDRAALAPYVLRLGDSALVLGHRLSEWCGHGPLLEEDIALTNIALDHLGHATALLRLAGQLDGSGRDEDRLAYFRDAVDFRNVLLVERPNGDFACTIARQFLFSAWSHLLWERLRASADAELAGLAARFANEVRYHLRHASQWMLRLGDGTEESARRVADAVAELWPYTGELFLAWPGDEALAARGVVPDPASLRQPWLALVGGILAEGRIAQPADGPVLSGGPIGRHGEALGHLLAEMQIVARSHPEATW